MSKPLLAMLTIIFLCSPARAESILCWNADRSLRSARHLDLAEGEFYEELLPSRELAEKSWQEQLAAAVNRLAFADRQLDRKLREFLDYRLSGSKPEEFFGRSYRSDMLFAPAAPEPGLRPAPLAAGCQLVGDHSTAGSWNRLMVSHFVWKQLPARDKASLLLNRALNFAYAEIHGKALPARLQGDLRRVVAYLLSDRFDGKSHGAAARAGFRDQPYFFQPRLYSTELFDSAPGSLVDFALNELPRSLNHFLSIDREKQGQPIQVAADFCPRGLTLVADYAVYDLESRELHKCRARVIAGGKSRIIEPFETKLARGAGDRRNAMVSVSRIRLPVRHLAHGDAIGPSSELVEVACAGSPWPRSGQSTVNSGGFEILCGEKQIGATINSRFAIEARSNDQYGSEALPPQADF